MPIKGFFYSSVANDRIYDADSWAALIRGLYSNGVFMPTGTELQVSATNPVTLGVLVAVGAGLTDGRYSEVYDAALSLTITTANPTNPRIDTVVLRRNLDPAVRAAQVVVKAGTATASPVAPTLQQDATIWEEPLANVAVAAGATGIVAANITDRRAAASARNALAVGGRIPGTVAGNIPILDANARVPDASALRGNIPGTAAFNIPLLGASGRLALGVAPSVPRVLIYNSGSMTLADNTTNALYFNSADFNSDNMFDTAVSNYAITVKTAGHYLIGAQGNWSDAIAEGERRMELYQGTTYRAAAANFIWAGTMAAYRFGYQTLSIVRPANVGDTFQVRAYQKSSGSLTLSDYHFYAYWIGP